MPVDKHTLQSTKYANIFAVGDASDIPASKAGSVAHFSVEIFVDNFLELIAGKPMTGAFDGHANCFVESGGGKGLLIDFNYDTQPLPGMYPLPVVGPMNLLKETRANHLGKLAFRWIYWNVLLPGRRMPLSPTCPWSARSPRTPPQSPAQTRRSEMPVTTIDGRPVHVNEEGFLTDPNEWDEALGKALAAQIGIDLGRALEGDPLPARGLRGQGRDPDAAPRDRCRRHPDQGAVPALPAEAGQEDGLHRRAAQAARLRLTHIRPH